MTNSTGRTSAIMDLKFNHEHELNTVDLEIYSQLVSLVSFAFCFLCFFETKYIYSDTFDNAGGYTFFL